MNQKQKMIAMLVAVGVLTGAGIGYIWFAGMPLTQEVAYQIQGKLNTSTSTGSVVITDTNIGYVSEVEGIGKLNRKGNDSLVQKDYILQSGDVLSTESGSMIEIIFADNSFVRVEENSKLIVASMNEVELKNGGLWARILKPLQDTSIFTIKASDLSAGVRGTVVRTTTSSGEMRIDVIDTTIGSGSAVDVTVNTASGILQENLSDEESLTILTNQQKKVKLNMDQMLQDEAIRDNLKKDILLMHRMMAETMNKSRNTPMSMMEIPRDQFQKMSQEIMRSLPKSNELNKFFVSQIIEDNARQLGIFSTAFSGSAQNLSTEEQVQLLISFTADDMKLVDMKKQLTKMRGSVGEFTDENKKQEYQNEVNTLEAQIRDFDVNWSKKERERIEAAKKAALDQLAEIEKLEGSGSIDTSGLINSSSGTTDSQTNTGIRVPNIGSKTLTGSTVLPVIPTVLPPKTSSGTLIPNPILPTKGVSLPASPTGIKSTTTIVPKIVSPTTVTPKIVSPTAIPR